MKREAYALNGHRAVMASRREAAQSLDMFPTPPWGTRALCELVLPSLGVHRLRSVWEPACGEGHMAEVLREYSHSVYASDVFNYGYSKHVADFLTCRPVSCEWVITNPPFGARAAKFVRRALELPSRPNVATFHQLRWIETDERYRLFSEFEPTLQATFAERVNIQRGKWNPDGSTATAYCWLVWLRDAAPRPPFRIPPGQRVALERPADRARFTAHPVIRL